MSVFFWLTTAVLVLIAVYKAFVQHDPFSIYTYVVLGVYVPIFFLLANWSIYVDTELCDAFYFLFSCFALVLSIAFFAEGGKVPTPLSLDGIGHRGVLILAITLVYVLACLVENYLGSGLLLPSLSGVDIHTYRAPIICYFTKAIFPVCFINCLAALLSDSKVEKVMHACLIALVLGVYLFGKSSRIEVCTALVQLLSFVFFARAGIARRKKLKRQVVIGAIVAVGCLSLFAYLGTLRAGQYGVYEVSYAEGIGYTGPELFGDYIAWFYGYFPLSINNLNISMKLVDSAYSLMGLDVFRFLYFGILQFDNFFGVDPYIAEGASIKLISEATVQTGFWNIWYDYGYLSILVFVFAVVLYRLFRNGIAKEKPSLFAYAAYFYWVPIWALMSFQNLAFDVFVATDLILLYALVRLCFPLKLAGKRRSISDAALSSSGLRFVGRLHDDF